MDDIAALTHHLEYLFLKKIIFCLRNQKITTAQAKEYSVAFLAFEPFTTSEDTYIKIMEFVNKYPLFVELKNHMNAYQREKNDLIKIAQIREYIKQNNIDAALDIAKN